MKTRVGVFDSGIGGLAVVQSINKHLPQVETILKSDKSHFPYGSRSLDDIYSFTKPILQKLIDDGCQVIVIACNTVTTNFITRLCQELPVPLVGMEPMLKPAAAATKTGIICVCATPRTLSSQRYNWLKNQYGQGIKVLEPDCSDWAYMIENELVDRERIKLVVESVCGAGADKIVLGCTHYHWIEELIRELAAGRAEVIQPEAAVIKQLKKVIAMNSFNHNYQDVGQHGPLAIGQPDRKNPGAKLTVKKIDKSAHAKNLHRTRTTKSTTLVRSQKPLS